MVTVLVPATTGLIFGVTKGGQGDISRTQRLFNMLGRSKTFLSMDLSGFEKAQSTGQYLMALLQVITQLHHGDFPANTRKEDRE